MDVNPDWAGAGIFSARSLKSGEELANCHVIVIKSEMNAECHTGRLAGRIDDAEQWFSGCGRCNPE
jgi:hypothetical protein